MRQSVDVGRRASILPIRIAEISNLGIGVQVYEGKASRVSNTSGKLQSPHPHAIIAVVLSICHRSLGGRTLRSSSPPIPSRPASREIYARSCCRRGRHGWRGRRRRSPCAFETLRAGLWRRLFPLLAGVGWELGE